ncbi:MAG: S-formylglutathione hydrolase [Candidatus Cloacimonadota bacterium]|nr:MAG: S-formylglutathione hydrolase [Candidatus Cloacimonadota bacterium]
MSKSYLDIIKIKSNKCFNGKQNVYKHFSKSTDCEMTFSVYFPNNYENKNVSVLFFLSGLTCTHENFISKAGSQALADELNLVIVAPDTSPRGVKIDGDDESWDFGTGAGFYLNSKAKVWSKNYNMYDYIVNDLYETIFYNFNLKDSKAGILGHSMGGHGAIMIALKNPDKFQSISAFSPILCPSKYPWGIKAFSNYLGDNKDDWAEYDSSILITKSKEKRAILIDQGLDDEFYKTELGTDDFEQIANQIEYPITLRRHEGYDHSYYFISSFLKDHFEWHKNQLR